MTKMEIRLIKESHKKNTFVLPKRVYIPSAIIIILGLALGVYYCFFYEFPFTMQYRVAPVSATDKLVKVNQRIEKRNRREDLELYKGDALVSNLAVKNSRGEPLEANEKDGFITIASKNENVVNVAYQVKLGNLAKHGHRGGMYDDMLTFDGEQLLLFPTQAFTEAEDGIKRNFKKVTIFYDMPDDWIASVPFAESVKNNGNAAVTKINSLTWSKMYELRKACYAFGKFKKFELQNSSGKINVYIDPGCKTSFSDETQQGLNALYDYYAKLFDGTLPEFSLVLLREDAVDHSYVLGGASSQTLGTTFNPEVKRDWELMGHRLFHAFCDSRIENAAFHIAPQLWFYEGLATYYENMSMGCLPDSIRKKLGIDVSEAFAILYKKYLYGRLKDPYLFALTPMNEEEIAQSGGKTEFLHYTQAPLIIKAIEDISLRKYGLHDRIIKYIKESKSENLVSLQGIVENTLGNEAYEFSKNYLFENTILALEGLSNRKEDPSEVIKQLNDFEYVNWTWLRLEMKDYPKDTLMDKELAELSSLAQKDKIQFAPIETENAIKKISPVLYDLLKQYALRAKVCGVGLNEPLARFKLLGDKTNDEKWESYRKNNVKGILP